VSGGAGGAAAGMVRVMDGPDTGPFNIGNPTEFTMLELAKVVQEVVNPAAEIVFRENTADDPSRRKPDITKARVAPPPGRGRRGARKPPAGALGSVQQGAGARCACRDARALGRLSGRPDLGRRAAVPQLQTWLGRCTQGTATPPSAPGLLPRLFGVTRCACLKRPPSGVACPRRRGGSGQLQQGGCASSAAQGAPGRVIQGMPRRALGWPGGRPRSPAGG